MGNTLVLFHVCAAMTGIIAGFLSMFLKKGSDRHRLAGNVFVVAMLVMSVSAVIVAGFIRLDVSNVLAGLLMFYLVTTGWLAGRRREQKSGALDVAAFLLIAGVAVGDYTLGIWAVSHGLRVYHGVPIAMYFVFGTFGTLFSISDLRMFRRGGITGVSRVARHLWRMCLALLLATLSFYPGQARLFSKELRATNVLWVPAVVLLGMTFFWLARVRRRRAVPGEWRVASRQSPIAIRQSPLTEV